MAFTITLYKFNKKVNSTKIPDNNTVSTSLTCNIKTSSSILSPRVELKESPIDYNYAYIERFNRYYFINDITYNIGVWVVDLSVDVLASFKSDILASSQYILRSASNYNTNIIDNLYMAKGNNTQGVIYASGAPVINGTTPISSYFDGILLTGCFILTIVSSNTSGVTTYALDNTAFKSVLSKLFSFIPQDMGDLEDGIKKQLFDPLQYITGVMWFPNFPNKGGTSVTSINIGSYSIDNIAGTCLSFDSTTWDMVTIDIAVSKHANSDTLKYLQLAPYSQYSLYFEPFGLIPLDTTKLYDVDTVRLRWYVEYQKGLATLEVVDKDNTTNIIASANGVIGVNLPIAQISNDILGSISAVANGAIGGALNFMTGNIIGGASEIGSALGNAIGSMLPQLTRSGTSDSFIIFRGEPPKIIYQFMDIVNDDLNRYGRPLCEVKVLNTLTGFTLCANAVLESDNCTGNERVEIESYLNRGLYLE